MELHVGRHDVEPQSPTNLRLSLSTTVDLGDGRLRMLFSLNHFPAQRHCSTIRKETGSWKWTGIAFLVPTIAGMILCFIVARLFG